MAYSAWSRLILLSGSCNSHNVSLIKILDIFLYLTVLIFIYFPKKRTEEIDICSGFLLLDEVVDDVLSDARCPAPHVALVLPGSRQQPGQEVARPAGVHLPENP